MPLAKAHISPHDNGFLYGDGFFDTMCVRGGVILELEEHLRRIEKSARRFHIRLPWPRTMLKKWILEVLKRNRLVEARLRVTVTRGLKNDHRFSRKPTLFISGRPITRKARNYTHGVSVETMRMERLVPEIKTLSLAGQIDASWHADKAGVHEMVIVDRLGRVSEASQANLFIVSHGTLLTPRTRMLPGMTRHRVILLARKMKLRVRLKDFRVQALHHADEAFLTNRLQEIVPVVRVDSKRLGNGKPGRITKKLMKAYQDYAAQYVAKHTS